MGKGEHDYVVSTRWGQVNLDFVVKEGVDVCFFIVMAIVNS
jgi:hypothetical protein